MAALLHLSGGGIPRIGGVTDALDPPAPIGDLAFRTIAGGYEVRFSNRIAEQHPELVDQCADWLEDEVGAVNVGQIDYSCLLADGVLGDQLREDIVGWWSARVQDFDPGGR